LGSKTAQDYFDRAESENTSDRIQTHFEAFARAFRSGEAAAHYSKWFDPLSVPMNPLPKAGMELQSLPD
jgi:hypothetical protein